MAVKEEEAQVIKVNKLILDLGAILEAGKYPNIWKLNNTFLYKLCFKEKKIKRTKFKGKLENI